MTTHIKVYPAKASALNVHHPIGGKPHSEGVDWPYDVFTCRRLTDGSFTEDATKAYKAPAPAAAATDKPAAAAPDAPGAADKPAAASPAPVKPEIPAIDAGKAK